MAELQPPSGALQKNPVMFSLCVPLAQYLYKATVLLVATATAKTVV